MTHYSTQTKSLEDVVDLTTIARTYHFDQQTIRPRNTTLDWFYGDVREVLAVSRHLATSLQTYCLNRVGGLYEARLDDAACSDSCWPYPQGFQNYFTNFEMALELLSSYGISGDVTTTSMTVYGLEVQTSLIGPSLSPAEQSTAPPPVRFCSPFPVSKDAGTDTGVEMTEYIVKAGVACSSGRRGKREESAALAFDYGQVVSTRSLESVDSTGYAEVAANPPCFEFCIAWLSNVFADRVP